MGLNGYVVRCPTNHLNLHGLGQQQNSRHESNVRSQRVIVKLFPNDTLRNFDRLDAIQLHACKCQTCWNVKWASKSSLFYQQMDSLCYTKFGKSTSAKKTLTIDLLILLSSTIAPTLMKNPAIHIDKLKKNACFRVKKSSSQASCVALFPQTNFGA